MLGLLVDAIKQRMAVRHGISCQVQMQLERRYITIDNQGCFLSPVGALPCWFRPMKDRIGSLSEMESYLIVVSRSRMRIPEWYLQDYKRIGQKRQMGAIPGVRLIWTVNAGSHWQFQERIHNSP